MWSLSHAHAFEQRQIAFDNDQVFHLLWIERRSLGSHHISSGWKHSFRFWTCRWHWKDDPDQVRKECQIYSPTVLIYYAVQSPTRIQPETRTFNHYPTRTRSEVKSVTRQTLLMQENAWLLEQFIKGSIFSLKAVWWIPDSERGSHPWICEERKDILKSPTRPNPRVGVSGLNHSTGLWIGSQQKTTLFHQLSAVFHFQFLSCAFLLLGTSFHFLYCAFLLLVTNLTVKESSVYHHLMSTIVVNMSFKINVEFVQCHLFVNISFERKNITLKIYLSNIWNEIPINKFTLMNLLLFSADIVDADVGFPSLFHDSSSCLLWMLENISLDVIDRFAATTLCGFLISFMSLIKSTFCTEGSLENSSSWKLYSYHQTFCCVGFFRSNMIDPRECWKKTCLQSSEDMPFFHHSERH